MANAIYPKFKQYLLDHSNNTDINSNNVKVALIDLADYTYSATHDFLDDIAGAAIVDTSGNLTTKTIVDGVFDSDNPVFSAASGDISEALILYVDTGVSSTSPLIAYYDTGVTGLPVTPNGGDINVTVNGSGWFAL